MIIALLLSGVALQTTAPAPPPPPAPPALNAVAPPPPPPLPPLPAANGRQVLQVTDNGRTITIVERTGEGRASQRETPHRLRYKDAAGKDVTVITDRPITQADAEALRRRTLERMPVLDRKAVEAARRQADRAQIDASQAREAAAKARVEGAKAQRYAQVVIQRLHDNAAWTAGDNDLGPDARAELQAMRAELLALRAELDSLKTQLRADPPR